MSCLWPFWRGPAGKHRNIFSVLRCRTRLPCTPDKPCLVRPPKALCRKERGSELCYPLGSVLKEPRFSLQSWSIDLGAHLGSAGFFSHLTGVTHQWCCLVVAGWGQIWLWSVLALPLPSIPGLWLPKVHCEHWEEAVKQLFRNGFKCSWNNLL